jgi:outer membrane receptor protein involved in Fe transport
VFDGGSTQAAIFNPTNVALLKPFEWVPVKPEQVQNIEVGFKSLINNELLIDAAYYYNIYHDFITQTRVRIADQLPTGAPNYATILNGTALDRRADGTIGGNTAQIYTNFTEQVTSQGAVFGITYSLPRGYTLGGNYNWNVLQSTPPADEFLSEFNTPEHKGNLMFGNRKVTDNFGFNVTWRWQSEFLWQSSFTIPANGMVPSYNTLDAQVTYRISSLKSVLKVGGSNLMNKKYFQSLGGPNIGAMYYVSLTFDELFR